MLKYCAVLAVLASLVAGSNQKFRIVNGKRIGTIENGQVQNPATYPFVVYLRTVIYIIKYDKERDRNLTYISLGRCGGSIIRKDIVLTAAHCIRGAEPENVSAFAGIVHLTEEQSSSQEIQARRLVPHEHYQKFWKNDIALVFLADSFEMSEYISTITLGKPSNYNALMNVTAVGWGRDENGQSPDWLYRGDFVMADRFTCASNVGFYDELLCAIDPNLMQKVCDGDSGGPLVSNNILVGISVGTFEPENDDNSTNESCDPSFPAVFTNVSHYKSWINREIAYDNIYFRYNKF